MTDAPPTRLRKSRRWWWALVCVGVLGFLFAVALGFPPPVPIIEPDSVPSEVWETIRDGVPARPAAGSNTSRWHCRIDAFLYDNYGTRFPVGGTAIHDSKSRVTYYVFGERNAVDFFFVYIVPDGTHKPRAKFTGGGA